MNDYVILYNILTISSIRKTISRAYTYIQMDRYIESSTITGLLIDSVLKINVNSKEKSLYYLQLLQDNLEKEVNIICHKFSDEDKESSKLLNINDLCYENQFLYVNQKKKFEKQNL